ncbi:MAG: LysM peptidoglycan-binding domain-containing protein [Kiritimatiellae bacterium]|nr:LysM peptidoglycan-binding domain-containing protein [Kiritimatiellia bacterium]MDW8458601.1 LysM peptidoglycan-binding domain-containing protein [Verrucomicrobiota bacterium]
MSFYFVAWFAMALIAGCGPGSIREQREERDPLLRRAQAKKNAGDIDGAIEAYLYAIEKRPRSARAHLELGWIYDHDRNDYLRAAYHYQRFLELRPDSKDRDLVEGLLEQARLSFATTLPEQPNGAVRRIRMLEAENAALRAEISRLTAAASPPPRVQTASSPTTAGPASAAIPAPPPPAPGPAVQPPASAPGSAQPATTYTVQPGDTLSRIAAKVYGDSKKWQIIYEANRASLPGGPQSIKVGQTLIIPRAAAR